MAVGRGGRKEKVKVKVWMLTGCRGEVREEGGKPEQLLPKTIQTVSQGFANSLFHYGRAEEYDGQEKAHAAAQKKKAEAEKKAEAKAEKDAKK